MTRTSRGAVAGAAAAAAWAGADRLFLQRLFGTPYSDSRVLSPYVARGRLESVLGVALHTAVGAVFGAACVRFGGRGWRDGVAAAVAENGVAWPALAVVDRTHPWRKDGRWPPLVTNGRVFAQATTGHALFGALLGLLLDPPR